MNNSFICPYCYEKHKVDETKITCSYNVSGKLCKNDFTKYSDGVVSPKQMMKCLDCNFATKYLHCPNVEELEKGIVPNCYLQSSSLSLALAGAKASGKSNYIAVLINEIRRKMSGGFDCNINMSADPYTKQEYDRKYFDPLFKQGRVVDATDKGDVRPLIFPIDFATGKMATLTFYDTAGENLDNNRTVETMNRYFTNAHGIILLLDPLQILSIREKLKDKIDLPPINTDAVDILDRLMGVIRGKQSIKNVNKRIDIPLAVVLTKMDVLEKFGLIEGGALKTESKHLLSGKFVESDFQAVDGQIKMFLEYLEETDGSIDHEIMSKIKYFNNIGFFGVTSLGGNPKGNKIEPASIKPRRVLDPLLWFLAQNNYIKKTRF